MVTLYSYYRSTASYRVRIALHLKQVEYNRQSIHLVNHGGEQFSPDYQAINPQSFVPSLVDGQTTINQSLAIIEYLEECHPTLPLLPKTPSERALVRGLSLLIACDIHPLDNLSVLKYLKSTLSLSDDQKMAWYHHWITQGFTALEARLAQTGSNGQFCVGEQPTMADCCLIPQVYNAHRFACPLTPFPLIQAINAHCLQLPAFAETHPEAH